MIKIDQEIELDDISEIKKKSLQELITNPAIAKFVKDNHLTYQHLSDYWAELLGFDEDMKECAICTGLAYCSKVSKGLCKTLVFDGNAISTTLSYCRFGEEKREENSLLRHFVYNNMSNKMALIQLNKTSFVTDATHLSENMKVAIKAIVNYRKHPSAKGIYLSGKSGSGKTVLLASLMNALARQGKDVGIMNMSTFLYEMKASFNNYEQDESYLNQVINIPYLLIDGLGDENVTAWSRDEILGTILNYRAINELPTFFTSTFSLDQLAQAYTCTKASDKADALRRERIADKISSMVNAYAL